MAPALLCVGKKSLGLGECAQQSRIQLFLEQIPEGQNPEFPAQTESDSPVSTSELCEGFLPKCDLLRVEFAIRCGFQAQEVAKGLLVAGCGWSLDIWAGATNIRDGAEIT